MLDALEPLLQCKVPTALVDKVDVPSQLLTTVTTGVAGVTQLTITLKLQVLVNPFTSVTTVVTTVSPTGKKLPLAGTLTMLCTLQLSVAVTVKSTVVPPVPDKLVVVTLAVISEGHIGVGGVTSFTTTFWVAVDVLLLASVKFQCI